MPAYTAYFTDGTDRVTALALNKLIRTFADLTNPNAVASLGGAADFNAKYPLMNITAGINKLAQIFNADKTDGHTLDVIRATEDHYNKITTTFSGYNAVANAAEAIIGVSSAVPGQSTSNPLVTAATNSYEAMYELQGMPAFKTMEELHQYFLAH